MRLIVTGFIVLFSLSAFASQAQRERHERNCAVVLETVAAMEQGAKVKTIRSLTGYLDNLPTLSRHLRSLDANSHILDFGSGEGLAMAEYLGLAVPEERAKRRIEEELGSYPRANVTMFSYKMNGHGESYRVAAKGKLRTVVGYFAEDNDVTPELLMGRFGAINLVIDNWGVLAYTADPTAVLNKLMPALAHNAVMVLRTGPREYSYLSGFGRPKHRSSLYRSRVDNQTFPDWLKGIRGWNVIDDGSVFDIFLPFPEICRIPQVWFSGMDPEQLEPMPGGRIFERDRP